MIKASHLSKRYGKKLAVDDISFEVSTGRVTGFLGPNGAGKSTTMRLMLGLDHGSGKTVYDGKTLQEYSQPAKMVGILLEAKAFHPSRTAHSHLKMLAMADNIPEKRVGEVLDIVGLSSEAKKKPGKFSLGMSQRLGIAAAILGNPKHLLLDEPANGLDPEGIAWLRDFLKDYASEGNTVFVSSHLLSEMSQMADDIVVIGKGRLIADMPIEKLLASSSHASVFVHTENDKKFIDSLKAANIKYERTDGGLRITGKKTGDIGRLAFDASIPVLELANQTASLEEAFLELTSGREEFVAKQGGKHS